MPELTISYAQNREDVILEGLLGYKKKGFYVDVGANQPVHESVTRLFYDKGWNGINIEPARTLCAMLAADRPRDINLQIGISNQDSELNFREYLRGDGLSTFSKDTQENYQKDKHYAYFAAEYIDHIVPVTTLKNVLSEHAADKRIDFMKIDVEGYEYEAIQGNDWEKYRPTILCIEANHVIKDWHPILAKAKYCQVFWDGLNEYFVAEEELASTKDFSYADTMFLGKQYIGWTEQKRLLNLQRAERQVRYDLMIAQQQPALAANQERALPTTFKGVIKYVLLAFARSYEAYLTHPLPPQPNKAQDEALDGTNETVVIQMLQHAAQSALSLRSNRTRRWQAKMFFAANAQLRAFIIKRAKR